jgi:hypothetical protein
MLVIGPQFITRVSLKMEDLLQILDLSQVVFLKYLLLELVRPSNVLIMLLLNFIKGITLKYHAQLTKYGDRLILKLLLEESQSL